jgi:hypothetical protein
MTIQDAPIPPPQFGDPEFVVFGGQPVRLPGIPEDHGAVDAFRNLFARKITDIQEDWAKVSGQIQKILESTTEVAKGYTLNTVTVELGFSAEGQLCFIAKSGLEASVSVTFTRIQTGPSET